MKKNTIYRVLNGVGIAAHIGSLCVPYTHWMQYALRGVTFTTKAVASYMAWGADAKYTSALTLLSAFVDTSHLTRPQELHPFVLGLNSQNMSDVVGIGILAENMWEGLPKNSEESDESDQQKKIDRLYP